MNFVRLTPVLLAALCLPAVPHLWEISARRRNWTLFVERPSAVEIATLFPLAVYMLLPGLILGLNVLLKLRGRRVEFADFDRRAFGLVLSWWFVPLITAWIATAGGFAVFHLRYLIGSAVAPAAFVGLLIALDRAKWYRITLAAATTLAVLSLGQSPRHQDWRGAVARINAETESASWPVFVRSGLIEARGETLDDPKWREFCLLPVRGLYRLERSDLIPLATDDAAAISLAQVRLIKSRGGAWFVLSGDTETSAGIESRLLRVLNAGGFAIKSVERFRDPGVTTLRVSAEPR